MSAKEYTAKESWTLQVRLVSQGTRLPSVLHGLYPHEGLSGFTLHLALGSQVCSLGVDGAAWRLVASSGLELGICLVVESMLRAVLSGQLVQPVLPGAIIQ